MSEKTIAIIQARSTSKRLPNKELVCINNTPVIGMIVSKLKAVNFHKHLIDEIIVAIPTSDPIKNWCIKNKVKYFEGSEADVLDRFYRCAKKHKADWVARICGDCPFLNDVLIAAFLNHQPRHKYMALPFNRGRIPGGWDCELISMEYLELGWSLSLSEREHITKNLRCGREDELDISLDELDFSFIKLDLDTKKDLRRLKEYGKIHEQYRQQATT